MQNMVQLSGRIKLFSNKDGKSVCSVKLSMELLAWSIIIGSCVSPSTQSNDQIDKEHLKLYPYCGKMFGHDQKSTSSRVVNSKESEKYYPWVVLVVRKRRNKIFLEDDKHERCSGTVIAYK